MDKPIVRRPRTTRYVQNRLPPAIDLNNNTQTEHTMSKSESEPKTPSEIDGVSRRDMLALTGTGLAALAVTSCAPGGDGATGSAAPPAKSAPASDLDPEITAILARDSRAPFDSVRDWMAALESNGLLMRFHRVDQDAYEIPALFFRATDRFSMYGAPAMLFDEVKIDGEWVKGPVIINTQGHWNTDAIIWDQPIIPGDHYATYRGAREYMQKMLTDNGGKFPEIPPVEVSSDKAPVKEVVLTGDDVDLTKYAFVETNPADAGRYVNTGSHFMVDPELGANFGTYRCQIKGPRKLGINPEPNQTGYKMLMAAKERGEKSMTYSIVLGQDPVVWMLSGTRVAPRGFGPKPKPADELAIAGGMRGKALEVVKSELTDILIPAHAEFVIEGEVMLDESTYEPEGPFGEMFGYLGPVKEENFVMHVKTITHRKNPWLMNALTGMQRGMVTAPMDAVYSITLKKQIPNFVEYTNPQDTMGIVIMSIDKTGPGQGLEAGMKIAKRNPIAKIVIVVDKEINILDRREVMFAVGSRWQPYPASEIIEETFGLMTDPSQVKYARTSKIVIDATRQMVGEGGKETFPETNRDLLIEGAPGVFEHVEKVYGEALSNWKRI
jgi:4-hydroxy-3-polyprenylbenzoate decarboxylase